jgi:uncharacterized SAM-dependent methyltransferase
VVETFMGYFYDHCAPRLFSPISNLPELKDVNSSCTGGRHC